MYKSSIPTDSVQCVAPLTFPKPWQRILTTGKDNRALFGVVVFSCPDYCNVLIDDDHVLTPCTDASKLVWTPDNDTGMLPLHSLGAVASRYGDCAILEAVNYDLLLKNGERVNCCFYKGDRFLEIALPYRHIDLADVASVRPSA